MADNCVSLARTNTVSSTITKPIKTWKTSNKSYCKNGPLDHKMAYNCVSLARTNTLSSRNRQLQVTASVKPSAWMRWIGPLAAQKWKSQHLAFCLLRWYDGLKDPAVSHFQTGRTKWNIWWAGSRIQPSEYIDASSGNRQLTGLV